MKKKIGILLCLGICSFIIKVDAKNIYIIKAYQYDQENSSSLCITGDETTCQETTCYQNEEKNSCKIGTILDYQVNNQKVVRFYVLHDDGDTITLQQRENTVNFIPWSSNDDYIANGGTNISNNYIATDVGPITILNAVEETVKDWTNIPIQTYILGKTSFLENFYTGCEYEYIEGNITGICRKNMYQLNLRTTKSRIITFQEANTAGCMGTPQTCPIWIYNYLWNSTRYGGTVDDNGTDPIASTGIGSYFRSGYWTLSAKASNYNPYSVYYISNVGYLTDHNNNDIYTNIGGRAVVVINKDEKIKENPIIISDKNIPTKTQTVNIQDTFKSFYIGYCLGTIILILGIMVSYQYMRKDKKEIKIKRK